MKMSSSLITPSAVAILATALLCGLSGTAVSQARLPGVTIDAPKQMARPHRLRPHRLVARPPQAPQLASTPAYRPLSPNPAPGAVMERFTTFETMASRAYSNCVDGCPTSFKHGNQPWVGCFSPGSFVLSTTCRSAAKFKTYEECKEVGLFVGWKPTDMWWYCSSLYASGKLSGEMQQQVAERSGRR